MAARTTSPWSSSSSRSSRVAGGADRGTSPEPDRQVHRHGPAGSRRHGDGLPGLRRGPRARGRREDAPDRRHLRRREPPPLRDRGQGRRAPPTPEHPHRLRAGRGPGRPLHRHGAPSRHRPRDAGPVRRAAAPGREARHRGSGPARARLRPRAQDRPQGHQAVEHQAPRRRDREDHGLRDREAGGDEPHEERNDDRDRALHEPRAGARPAPRRAQRRLLRGRDPVRPPGRAAAFRGRGGDPGPVRHHQHGPAAPRDRSRRGGSAPRGHRRAGPRQGSRRAVPDRGAHGRRAGGGPRHGARLRGRGAVARRPGDAGLRPPAPQGGPRHRERHAPSRRAGAPPRVPRGQTGPPGGDEGNGAQRQRRGGGDGGLPRARGDVPVLADGSTFAADGTIAADDTAARDARPADRGLHADRARTGTRGPGEPEPACRGGGRGPRPCGSGRSPAVAPRPHRSRPGAGPERRTAGCQPRASRASGASRGLAARHERARGSAGVGGRTGEGRDARLRYPSTPRPSTSSSSPGTASSPARCARRPERSRPTSR